MDCADGNGQSTQNVLCPLAAVDMIAVFPCRVRARRNGQSPERTGKPMNDDSCAAEEDDRIPSGGFRTVFDSFLHSQRPLFSLAAGMWNPPTDVFETASELVVKIEVPGMRPGDFEVSVRDGRLHVSGSRTDPDHAGMKCLHQVEVRYGRFERIFELTGKISLDEIQANYEQGFLRIRLPKRIVPPKRIAVTTERD